MKKTGILVIAVCLIAAGLLGGCRRREAGINPADWISIEMVRIPAGTFIMGSPEDEPERLANEGPQRQVTLSSDFFMGRTQVTQGQWYAVMGTNPSPGLHQRSVAGHPAHNYPVANVSWYDAIVFANRLSMLHGLRPAYEMETVTLGVWGTNPDYWGPIPTGNNARWNAVRIVENSNGYRLPTEAQWEYAARAGTTTAFNDGASRNVIDASAVGLLGWFAGNSGGRPRETGQLQANDWGLHDMHGNVLEWVWDWLEIYPDMAEVDPTGAPSGDLRVCRGASWGSPAYNLRSARRFGRSPFNRFNNLGFRLVRPLV